METIEKIHPFEKSGMGVGPFSFVGSISLPSQNLAGHNPNAYNNALRMAHAQAAKHDLRLGSCYHCGMGILHHCIISDRNGTKFLVGNVCVQKTGDKFLGSKTKIAARKMAARVREQNKQIKHEIWLASPSEENPELTNEEIAEVKRLERIKRGEERIRLEREKFVATHIKQMETWGFWVEAVWGTTDLERLERALNRRNPGFVNDMTRSMMTGCTIYGRAWDICGDIYAKTQGRRNSRAYSDAYDEYTKKVAHLRE